LPRDEFHSAGFHAKLKAGNFEKEVIP